MDFCPKCDARLRPLPASDALFCRKCQHEIRLPPRIEKKSWNDVSARLKDSAIIVNTNEVQLDVFPTTRVECPKCSHDRAHYRTLEIWSEEEDNTDIQIFRCMKCKHTWREKT